MSNRQLEVQWKMSLVSGGWIALTIDLNSREPSEQDRQFILHLLDSVREYATSNHFQQESEVTPHHPPAEGEGEEGTVGDE